MILAKLVILVKLVIQVKLVILVKIIIFVILVKLMIMVILVKHFALEIGDSGKNGEVYWEPYCPSKVVAQLTYNLKKNIYTCYFFILVWKH